MKFPEHYGTRRSVLILSSHLILDMFPLPHKCQMPRSSNSFLLITQNTFGENYSSLSSLLCSLLHSPVTSSLLSTNIFLNTLFSNNLRVPSRQTSDNTSHHYGTTNHSSQTPSSFLNITNSIQQVSFTSDNAAKLFYRTQSWGCSRKLCLPT